MTDTELTALELSVAEPADAVGLVDVIHRAFGARAPIDPPPPALSETAETLAREIAQGTGVIAWVGERPVGVILLQPTATPGVVSLQRVSVDPDFQHHGVGATMVAAVQEIAADAGHHTAELFAREEFPEVIAWWEHRGFRRVREVEHGVILSRPVPVAVAAPTRGAMHELGERLAAILRPGDLIIASGDLGAGKTTLTQGIGRGLGVEGPVISPTFVLSRVHRNPAGGPDLIHVDAYRLGSAEELEDLDLGSSSTQAVTLVEWGTGLAEGLADDRLEVFIRRSDVDGDETRRVYLTGVGPRWQDGSVRALAAQEGEPQ